MEIGPGASMQCVPGEGSEVRVPEGRKESWSGGGGGQGQPEPVNTN